MNKANLTNLMNFLLSNDLPFDMMDYRTETKKTPNLPYASFKLTKDEIDAGPSQCNTAGCGLGWAPFVVPPKPEHFTGDGSQDDPICVLYEKYLDGEFGFSRFSKTFDFLFGSDWADLDNTRQGVAFRIHDFITDQTFFNLSKDENLYDFYADYKQKYEEAKAAWLNTVRHS